MKRLAVLLSCVVWAGWASAQQPRPSSLEQARDQADNALRRESDLTAGIAAQERANVTVRNQLRKADVDPAGLQKDLVDASADAAAIRRRVAAQKLRYDIAADNLADARVNAVRRLDQSNAAQSAQRAFDDAASEMERLSQPIFEQLEQTPEYQQAQALADAAAQTGEALQGFDAVDPKAQAEADAAYDQAIASVRALEDAAIDADPKAAETNKALKKAQETLAGLQAENERRIASDPKVDGAKFAFDAEQKSLNESSAELAAAEKRLSALRQAAVPKGGATDLAMQLKDGEDRLHAMSDQLEQARAARREADEKLRYLEDIAAAGNANNGDGLPPFPLPQSDSYANNYGGYYPAPAVSYVYPQYQYYPYDSYYCPPYYSSGIFFGTSFYSRSYCYPRYYDRFCGFGYNNHYRDSSWRNRYDAYRGRGGFVDVRNSAGRFDGRLGYSSRSSNFSSLGRADLTRDSRLMTDYARHSSAVERDERGTRVSTYGYPGSTTWRQRDLDASSSRSRQVEDSRERGTITITRTGSRRGDEQRSVQDDSGARHASYSDSPRSSHADSSRDRTVVTESRSERSTSGDSSSRQGREADSHSQSSADSGRSRGGDSTARSSSSGDSARSRGSAGSSIGSSGGSSAGSSRGGGGGSPSYSAAPSRGSSPSPSGGSSRGSSGSSGGGSSSRGGGSSSSGSGGGRGR